MVLWADQLLTLLRAAAGGSGRFRRRTSAAVASELWIAIIVKEGNRYLGATQVQQKLCLSGLSSIELDLVHK